MFQWKLLWEITFIPPQNLVCLMCLGLILRFYSIRMLLQTEFKLRPKLDQASAVWTTDTRLSQTSDGVWILSVKASMLNKSLILHCIIFLYQLFYFSVRAHDSGLLFSRQFGQPVEQRSRGSVRHYDDNGRHGNRSGICKVRWRIYLKKLIFEESTIFL